MPLACHEPNGNANKVDKANKCEKIYLKQPFKP